jgi:hypothetical protein
LRHIDIQNDRGSDLFVVSHAWTDGPVMYLVYTVPPPDVTLGLVIGIGARHRQKLRRRTMTENKISPASHITLADMKTPISNKV